MKRIEITHSAQIHHIVKELTPGQVIRIDLIENVEECMALVSTAIRQGQIEAVYQMFNGRRDEFWRVTRENIDSESVGAPVALMLPGTAVAISEDGF